MFVMLLPSRATFQSITKGLMTFVSLTLNNVGTRKFWKRTERGSILGNSFFFYIWKHKKARKAFFIKSIFFFRILRRNGNFIARSWNNFIIGQYCSGESPTASLINIIHCWVPKCSHDKCSQFFFLSEMKRHNVKLSTKLFFTFGVKNSICLTNV